HEAGALRQAELVEALPPAPASDEGVELEVVARGGATPVTSGGQPRLVVGGPGEEGEPDAVADGPPVAGSGFLVPADVRGDEVGLVEVEQVEIGEGRRQLELVVTRAVEDDGGRPAATRLADEAAGHRGGVEEAPALD